MCAFARRTSRCRSTDPPGSSPWRRAPALSRESDSVRPLSAELLLSHVHRRERLSVVLEFEPVEVGIRREPAIPQVVPRGHLFGAVLLRVVPLKVMAARK